MKTLRNAAKRLGVSPVASPVCKKSNCLQLKKKMWQRNLFSVTLVFVYVSCEKDAKDGSRKSRLFTFNTLDDDIRVDLDFSVPFLSIPVKPTMDNVFGSIGIPTVNINLAGLVLGGGVVIASTFLLPLLLKSFTHRPPYDRYAKILEHTQFGADTVLDFTSNVLSGGVQGCTLRVACWSGQRDHEDGARFWTGVMSNQLMSTLVNSTAVEDAIATGRRGRDCSEYSPCPLTAEHYPLLMKNLMQLSNSNI